MFIAYCKVYMEGICPAHLSILRKYSPLHGPILVCTFNVFQEFSHLHVYFALFVYSAH